MAIPDFQLDVHYCPDARFLCCRAEKKEIVFLTGIFPAVIPFHSVGLISRLSFDFEY